MILDGFKTSKEPPISNNSKMIINDDYRDQLREDHRRQPAVLPPRLAAFRRRVQLPCAAARPGVGPRHLEGLQVVRKSR